MTPQQRALHEAEGLFVLKAKPGHGMCGVRGCRNELAPRKMSICHKHWQQRWRMQSPKKSAYAMLRDHAKERGIKFTLTPDYFRGFCDAFARFDQSPDTYGQRMTVDRVDATRGYEEGNIAILTLTENVAKGNRERHLPAHVQAILDRKRARMQESPEPVEEEEKCPF